MAYRFMRSIVIFDLPVGSKKQRRAATQFRKALLDDGFEMLQYSVYTRICQNGDDADKHLLRVKRFAPSTGSIRMLSVTENQYSKMKVITGEKNIQEKAVTYQQLSFF